MDILTALLVELIVIAVLFELARRLDVPYPSLFVIGGLVLFLYGYVVNAQPWDFGRLLGVYVVFFFVVAQLISWIIFHQRPSTALLIGGAFIVTGGIIISVNR